MLSPALRENRHHVPIIKKFVLFLALTFPKFRWFKSSGRNATKLKLDNYLKTDKFIYRDGIWTNTLQTMMTSLYLLRSHFSKLRTPYLIVQSGTDKLIDPFMAIDL